MDSQHSSAKRPIAVSVRTELQAAHVTKICQDYGIHAVIKIKPVVDLSQLKKAVKQKMQDRLYHPCPCGKDAKYKFCCYKKNQIFDF